MQNRKEPRLEMEEPQLTADPESAAAKPKKSNQGEAVDFEAFANEPKVSEDEPVVEDEPIFEEDEPVVEDELVLESEPIVEGQQSSKPKKKSSSNKSAAPKKSSSGKAWLALLLALLALGLLAWQFLQLQQTTQQIVQQQQSLQLLGDRVLELESMLSTTGSDLSAAGKKLNDKLEWADSEIRKLWVIAHQRNRPAIDGLENKTKQLEQSLSKAEKQLAEALETSKAGVIATKATTEKSLVLTKDLKELSFHVKELTQRLTEVSLTTSTLDERLRNQDLRTGLAALEKQVSSLSTATSNAVAQAKVQSQAQSQSQSSQPNDLQVKLAKQLAEQQEILASLEASRGQLVSRVTRLMEEVRALQQGR